MVLLAGAMAAYRPAESEKPVFLLSWQTESFQLAVHTGAPPPGVHPECPPRFYIVFQE